MSSGFVTETEAAEARKRRQEEWEKVRTPDQPMERPEEPYDGRSLFDRLKEQKMKKDMEYEEAHKLKNLIRGLDDDEVQFLELVDQNKIDAERKQMQEEEKELNDYRNRVATLQEEAIEKKKKAELKLNKAKPSNTDFIRPTQKSLLGLGIKRKNAEEPVISPASAAKEAKVVNDSKSRDTKDGHELNSIQNSNYDRGILKCVAVLPGIGPYTESSDSEISSGSEEEPETGGKYDLCGRKRECKKKQCNSE